METFSQWLSHTEISLFFQEQLGFLAFLQAIHIMAIAMIGSSVLMIDLRILALAGRSQTMAQVAHRFVPSAYAAACSVELNLPPLSLCPRNDTPPRYAAGTPSSRA